MSQTNTGPSIIGGLVSALCSLWRQKTTAAALFGLYLVIAGLMFVAPFDLYAGLFEAITHDRGYRPAEAPGDNLLLALAIMLVVGLVGGGILMALLGRLIALGRERMFEGGLPALTRRCLWVIWRFAEMMILLTIAYLLLYLLMIITNWLYGLSAEATWQGLVVILHMVLVMALIAWSILAIFAVVSLTIWAACQDRRLGLVEAWHTLKGLRLRLMLTLFVLMAMTTLIGSALMWLAVVLFPQPGGVHYVTSFLGLGSADFLTGYLWLAVGGQYAPASSAEQEQ